MTAAADVDGYTAVQVVAGGVMRSGDRVADAICDAVQAGIAKPGTTVHNKPKGKPSFLILFADSVEHAVVDRMTAVADVNGDKLTKVAKSKSGTSPHNINKMAQRSRFHGRQ